MYSHSTLLTQCKYFKTIYIYLVYKFAESLVLSVTGTGGDLDVEQRNQLSIAIKNVIRPKRDSWYNFLNSNQYLFFSYIHISHNIVKGKK